MSPSVCPARLRKDCDNSGSGAIFIFNTSRMGSIQFINDDDGEPSSLRGRRKPAAAGPGGQRVQPCAPVKCDSKSVFFRKSPIVLFLQRTPTNTGGLHCFDEEAPYKRKERASVQGSREVI